MRTVKIGSYHDPIDDESKLEEAKKVLIGIADSVNDGWYRLGYRNNTAVDLSIACYLLGIDPNVAIDELRLSSDEYMNLRSRVYTVSLYIQQWAQDNDIWSYSTMGIHHWLSWYVRCEENGHALEVLDQA